MTRDRVTSFALGVLLTALVAVAWTRQEHQDWRARVMVTDPRTPIIEVYVPERQMAFVVCFPISEDFSCYSSRVNVMRRGVAESDLELANVREMMLVDAYTLIYQRSDYANGELQISSKE